MEEIRKKIEEADLVLVGIGEKFAVQDEEAPILAAYQTLAKLLDGKNYFVITTCVDGIVYEVGLKEERIVRPLAEEENSETDTTDRPSRWETYMKWLQGTLNKKLFVLELGVGLKHPEMIRFPFEKIAYFNQKADFMRIHDKLFQLPAELGGKGISRQENPVELLANTKI